MSSYQALVFDLDDTLLDTSTQLVPRAAREAAEAMVASGLATDVETCLAERARVIAMAPREDLYARSVAHFGVRPGAEPGAVASCGYNAFHDREVQTDLVLIGETRTLLSRLRERYAIFLVTAGTPRTQMQKVQILRLAELFRRIYYVDPSRGESKRQAFEAIMQECALPPNSFLSIGNRLDSDIADAKTLGWDTCWVRFGEYRELKPRNDFERADFVITGIDQLESQCQL